METRISAGPEIHELVAGRWSPRAFAEKPVEKEKLLKLFEAARWAPSCYGEQPWRFVFAAREDPANYRLLFDCLAEANQVWAGSAPVLMVSIAKTAFSHNGKPNRHAWHDVGLAMGNLLLQAAFMGLCVHQMAGFSREKARENLRIPEGFEPVAAVALGYLGDAARLPDKLREIELAPRKRIPLEEFVFSGSWGNALG